MDSAIIILIVNISKVKLLTTKGLSRIKEEPLVTSTTGFIRGSHP
jgi:hypothetical protein